MGPRARKALAVLAGGTVLTGGCVTTLASWTDETNDRAPLTLSSFSLLQSTGGGYVPALPSTAPGTFDLTFGNSASLLTPGGSVMAWVGLKVAAGSVGGTVTMHAPTIAAGADPAGIASQLTYQATTGAAQADCRAAGALNAALPGTALVPASSTLSAGGSRTFHLDAGATSGAQGAEVGVCLKLSLADGIAKSYAGNAVTPVWRFSAVSDA